MNKLSIAIIALAVVCGVQTSRAADLAPVVTKAPPPAAPVSDWTGFYLGGDVGLRATDTKVDTDAAAFLPAFSLIGPTTVTSEPMNGTAARFGGYAGYNWQFAPTWVAGIEGDFGWANKSVTLNGVFLPGGFFAMPGESTSSLAWRSTWDASVRARLGYLVTPSTMVYVTGGPAWLHFDTTATCGLLTCGAPIETLSNSSTRLGWTVGGGLETRLWGHWLGRAEYRYSDFGTTTYTDAIPFFTATYDEKVRTQTALLGLAYKFGDPVPAAETPAIFPTKAPLAAPRYDWSGAYVGIDPGLRSNVTNATENGVTVNGVPETCVFTAFLIPPLSCVGSEPMNGSSFRLGGHLGYDWQFAQLWVAGLEADAGWADHTVTFGGSPFPGSLNGFLVPVGGFSGLAGDNFSVKTTWDTSIRARFGILATPSILLYVTGGPSWQHFESTATCGLSPNGGCFATMSPLSMTNDTTKLGWTVGAGAETRLWSNWFARAEYRFADYGTTTYTDTVVNSTFATPLIYKDTYSLQMQTHTVTFGLSYKFWDVGPSPM
jgi:outer membrane immunogenic protein